MIVCMFSPVAITHQSLWTWPLFLGYTCCCVSTDSSCLRSYQALSVHECQMHLFTLIQSQSHFFHNFDRRRLIRRTTRRLRSLVRKDSRILTPDDDSDDNLSDTDLVWTSSKLVPNLNMGRRQNSGRPDIESGLVN